MRHVPCAPLQARLPWRPTTLVVAILVLLIVSASSTQRAVICENRTSGALVARAASTCPPGLNPVRLAGANIFDVVWDSNPGMGLPNGQGPNITVAKQQLLSASRNGIRVFRFFASLWGPNQAFWRQNATAFWGPVDEIMAYMASAGLYAIPSLGYSDWHRVANVLYPGLNESLNDCVRNSTSRARALATQFFTEFVTRYADNENVLAWELGNELNLMVNLPPGTCGPGPCFDHAEMDLFLRQLAEVVRRSDVGPHQQRPVSSGLSSPRPSAWHMEHCGYPGNATCPYWGANGLDSQSQWREALREQNQGCCEIWSIHHYASTTSDNDACYFAPRGHAGAVCSNASIAAVAAKEAAADGAILYVGEYGGPAPNFTGPTPASQRFPEDMLQLQVRDAQDGGAFMLSTVWAWACPTHRADMNCIWPGSNDPREAGSARMIALLQNANKNMAAAAAEVAWRRPAI
eukprot:UC1_evm4s202